MEISCRGVAVGKLLACLFILCFKTVISDGDFSELHPKLGDSGEGLGDVKTRACAKCECDEERDWRRKEQISPSPIPDVSDACQQVLQNFSNSAADFTMCLGMNARPVTICLKCIEEYVAVHNWFANISSGSGASCDTELMNRDHLQVVPTIAKQAEMYWTAAQCPNCFSQVYEDGIPKVCNDTTKFFALLNEVISCINKTDDIVDGNVQTKNESQVCQQCGEDYHRLNDHYNMLNTKYSNRLCMDLMDAMNITRHMWSSTYKCTYQNVESLSVILASTGFLLMPVIYYCGNRFVAHARDTKIIPQKRMSFVQTSYSSSSLQR